MTDAAPFRLAPDDAVRAGAWRITTSDGDEPLPDWLADWDISQALVVAQALEIDPPRLTAEAGLPAETPLDVTVLIASGLEIEACAVPVPPGGGEMSIELPLEATLLASTASLSTRVVLRDPGDRSAADSRIAWRRGSILWEEVRSVRLYGDASQFPIMEADFADLGLDAGAPWFLQVSSDLERPAMGSILLLLNDRYPLVLDAAKDIHAARAELSVVRSALSADVGRLLVEIGLSHPEIGEQWPEDSLGGVLRAIVKSRLRGTTEELTALREQDPAVWGSLLASTFDLLREPLR
jgi:hypothetical protein